MADPTTADSAPSSSSPQVDRWCGSTTFSPALVHAQPCRCAECEARRYALEQMLRADRLQQELARMDTAMGILRRQLALADYKRLTAETRLAVKNNDRVAWEAAISEREGVEVSAVDALLIAEKF